VPRIARAIAIGFPHHIVQRGNNKETIFFEKEDKDRYISLLSKYANKWNSPILAYCLMDNHVHLLAKPKSEESLYKMMQGITLCYTQYVNKKYKRTGRLWESRYYSCIVDKERYLWSVARYIEQNPKRAKVVKDVEDYPYSSARAHIRAVRDDILGDELFEEEQINDYRAFIKSSIPGDEISSIRYHTRTGRPLGSEEFLKKMEKKLERRFWLKLPGRPRKRAKE
jgi:putative transposase